MKRTILLLIIVVWTVIAFAACTNNSQNTSTTVELQETPAPTGIAEVHPSPTVQEGEEMLAPELYPAYILEGAEKKWGYINQEGRFVIAPKYEYATDFKSNGMADVQENGRWGRIDKAGQLVFMPQYLYISDFSEGKTIAVSDAGMSYLLDEMGEKLFETDGAINSLSGGRAAFSRKVSRDRYLWGYINEKGTVVIEPQYAWAQSFSNGKAIVGISEGHFAIINEDGKLIRDVDSGWATSLSEDIFVFSKTDETNGQRYGYMTVDGEVLLDAVYCDAEEFEDGVAIVNAAKDFSNQFGLINKKGEFVIPAQYARITSLKHGLYAVPKAPDYYDFSYAKKALFDKTGKQLTEFKYYDLERLENGLISATDDRNTYLIDEKGNEVSRIPKAEGIGSIKPCGQLYKVEADNRLYYLSQEGKTLWASDDTFRLDGGWEIRIKSFRPDRCLWIQYPEITGPMDAGVRDKINGTLKEMFIGSYKASNKVEGMYTDLIEIDFTVDKNKDLLIIRKDGYFYPMGAAHGQPTREDYHISLKTGDLFMLKDLFKKDSNYKERLTDMVQEMIAKANQEFGDEIYSEDVGDLEKNSGFSVMEDSLQIYFYPYAIAPYAAGFPAFYISYEKLKDMVNPEGDFWRSFDREMTTIPKYPEQVLQQSEKAKIEEAVMGYENSLMEAIEKNDFKRVEPWLYPDSSLYTSQKKLVADLNQKKIKERLEGYSIESILDSHLGFYRVYVTESIGIQYPGKDYVTKQFHWVYSLRYSNESQCYQLTYIDQWEKQ